VNAVRIGWVVFACVFGGALLGMLLRRNLPEHHLSSDSKDVVKLGMGLLATMSALVLSLLIASAKSSYDTERRGFERRSANLVLLDGALATYGPEAEEARALLRRSVVVMLERNGPQNPSPSSALDDSRTTAANKAVYGKIQQLSPQDDMQRSLKSQILQIAVELGRTRWLLVEEQEDSSIPMPFLVVLVFWLAVLFASFGLFGPPNATVIGTLFVCALSVSGAIFLILELDQPAAGLIQISSAPLRNALAHLGH
jgi:hypothetical protein